MVGVTKKRIRIIILAALVVVAGLILRIMGLESLFSLENLKSHHDVLQLFVSQHYLWSIVLYLLVYTALVSMTLPIAILGIIAAGLLFGFWVGLILVMVGTVAGSTISFLAMRYLFKETIPDRFKARLACFDQKLNEHGALYLLSLHLLGVTPFFIVNALAALANVSIFTFTWTTVVGIIPTSVLFVYMGCTLSNFSSINDVFTTPVLILLALLAFLTLLPILITRFRKKI